MLDKGWMKSISSPQSPETTQLTEERWCWGVYRPHISSDTAHAAEEDAEQPISSLNLSVSVGRLDPGSAAWRPGRPSSTVGVVAEAHTAWSVRGTSRTTSSKMPAVSKGDGMRGLAVFISDIRNCEWRLLPSTFCVLRPSAGRSSQLTSEARANSVGGVTADETWQQMKQREAIVRHLKCV